VGNSGSGKSTLGRALAAKIGADFTEMDGIFHQPNWAPLPAEEFAARISAIVAGDAWVIDGNYSAVQELIWSRADTVAWIDPPRWRVMRQLIWRTLRRVGRNETLWNGNRERWRNFFALDPQESVIAWAWTKHRHYRRKYREAAADPANARLHFVHLRSRTEINAFIRSASPS
jgi:adenylate kinase family enzyme